MNQVKVINKEKLSELFSTQHIQDEIETVASVLPPVLISDSDTGREVADAMKEQHSTDAVTTKFSLMLEILKNSNNIEDLKSNVDQSYRNVKNKYERNIEKVFEQTKSFERTARSLSLLYQNAFDEANVYIMPVDKNKFADSANPKDFNAMSEWIRKKYYKWFMEESPFYISYIGDIGDSSAITKMAQIAHETKALAVVDTYKFNKAEKAIKFAEEKKIKGIAVELAHVVVPGTWLYAKGAKEVKFLEDANGNVIRQESKMAVPASGAFVGKMLSVNPAVTVTGIQASRIIGMDGVTLDYDKEKIDAHRMSDKGLLQIINEGFIMGSTTLNKSANRDLNKFDKVDVANAMLKDLVQFCNDKSFSRWGNAQEKSFRRELENYFNRRIKQNLIQGYNINTIEYDTNDEQVKIDITVNFFEIADTFEINLHGPKNSLVVDVKN